MWGGSNILDLLLDWKENNNVEARVLIQSSATDFLSQQTDKCYILRIDDEILYSNFAGTSSFINPSKTSLMISNGTIKFDLYSRAC